MARISRGKAHIEIMDLTDGKQLISYISANNQRQVIYDPDTKTYTPNFQTTPLVLTPNVSIYDNGQTDITSQMKAVKWYVQVNSTGAKVEITNNSTYSIDATTKQLTVKQNVLESNVSMRYSFEATYTDQASKRDLLAIADIELTKITNGSSGTNASDPITGVLTNDAQSIQTKYDGTGGIYTGVESSLMVYKGSSDVTSQWVIVPTPSTGVTGTYIGGVYKVTNMTQDTGTVTFTATNTNYPNTSIRKVFTITKIRNGADGTVTHLQTSTGVIKLDENGVYTPGTVTLTGRIKVGETAEKDYAGRFVVSETLNGNDYTVAYRSSANETSKTITPSTGIQAIKVELFQAGGTIVLLDSEIIHVVADGIDSVVPVIDTPNGVVTRNHDGILTAVLTLYKGVQEVSGDFYKWYRKDASEAGDAYSGAGWYALGAGSNTEGYYTDTLSVSPEALTGTQTFMCVTQYKGRTYRSTISLSDLTDPYVVSVLGMDTFKNGRGEHTYTCKVYHNGVEKDEPGYTYEWRMYDGNNVLKDNFSKSGKTITVNAEEMDHSAVLVCRVDDGK